MPFIEKDREAYELLNFMTKDISRFIDAENLSEANQNNFRLIFDAEDFRDEWRGLEGLDREDQILRAILAKLRLGDDA